MHIDNKELEKFQNGTMEPQDMIAFLEHLDNCNFCLDQMTRQEEASLTTAPSYLKEQILTKASSPEVKVAKTASETSRKMQMFYYSLQTAVGILTALFLLFGIGTADLSRIRPEHTIQTVNNSRNTNRLQGNYFYDLTQGIGQGIADNTSSITEYLNNIFK